MALNYFAVGEIVLAYLRDKKLIDKVSPLEQMRISLETNFVNHVLPSGGASGMSYMTWRLNHHGVPVAKGTMAQVVRTFTGFLAFIVLLAVAVIAVTVDGTVNRWVILISSVLVFGMLLATGLGIYVLKSLVRIRKLGAWLTRTVNKTVYHITFGRKRAVLKEKKIVDFMQELHEDYLKLRREKHVLKKPFWWSVIFLATDVLMFFVTFWALGNIVNPALILIAYGLGIIAGFIVITPGGSGVYELLMVGFLAASGIAQDVGIAGVVLTRVLILIVIIAIGYFFYQHALVKYGKRT